MRKSSLEIKSSGIETTEHRGQYKSSADFKHGRHVTIVVRGG